MKITEPELEELKALKGRDDAIHRLLQKMILEQERLDAETEQWFKKVRDNYGIKPEAKITVMHDTGKIIIQPEEGAEEGS